MADIVGIRLSRAQHRNGQNTVTMSSSAATQLASITARPAAKPDLASCNADLSTVLSRLDEVLLGKQQQVRLALACLIARGHLLLEDVPGVGKTTLAQALATSLGLPWTRVQFTSDLLPADVLGVSIWNSEQQRFEFRPGAVFTSVLLADEINRAPPRAQSALLEAMEERQVSVDGVSHTLDPNFFVIATQNPADQLGAFPLPESQLDRFLVGLSLGYPDPHVERRLLEQGDRRAALANQPALVDTDALANWSELAQRVHVASTLYDYIQNLLTRSRTDTGGLSPRAGLSLVRLARAHALIEGREHLLPDDIKAVFPALAGHRLTGRVATGEARARAILESVPMP